MTKILIFLVMLTCTSCTTAALRDYLNSPIEPPTPYPYPMRQQPKSVYRCNSTNYGGGMVNTTCREQ